MSSSFVFVLIPASSEESMVELSGNISGGLENDEVQLYAKRHLGVDIVNICSLGLPTPKTGYVGISLYSHCEGMENGLLPNTRATEIVQACGHKSTVIYGDAFLSRYYDNEDEPWRRLDFRLTEANISSEWVGEVAVMNQGKKMSSYTTGGSLQQLLANTQPAAAAPPTPSASAIPARNSTYELFKWSQAADEVEIQFSIPSQIKAKDIKIKFSTNSILINIVGLESIDTSSLGAILSPQGARLQHPVRADECLWSITNEGKLKYLVITLSKATSADWTNLLSEN